MARTGLKKAAVLAVIGSFLLGTGGAAIAAPFHHYDRHPVYRHDGPGAGLVVGAAIGTIFGIVAAAAAANNDGYYDYGPSYPPPGYYAPPPYYGYGR